VTGEAVDHLLPIGQFARSCRLSIKALRHYDELGLLRPASVDRVTGYRYYQRRQVRAAITIGLLRSLGVPLERIRDLLAARGPEGVGRVLQRERERIERELSRARRALASIDRMLRDGSPTPYEVTEREEPTRIVLCLDATTNDEREIDDTTALVDRLFAIAAAHGLSWTAPVLCLLPEVRDEAEFPIRVGIGLSAPTGDVGEARLEVLRGGPCAVVRHVGAYEELALAHHALVAWTEERGHREAGPMREYYLNDPREVDAAELATDVLLPITKRASSSPVR
jgi:DNA-binding transcriptional MerR regulator